MPSQIIRFMKKPSHMLAVLVSLAALAVGSVVAMRVFASDIPDGFSDREIDHVYYEGQADKFEVWYYGDSTGKEQVSNLQLIEGATTLSGDTLKDDNGKLLNTSEHFPTNGDGVSYSQYGNLYLKAQVEYDGKTYSATFNPDYNPLDKAFNIADYADRLYFQDENNNGLRNAIQKKEFSVLYDEKMEEYYTNHAEEIQQAFDNYAYQNAIDAYKSNYWGDHEEEVYDEIALAHGGTLNSGYSGWGFNGKYLWPDESWNDELQYDAYNTEINARADAAAEEHDDKIRAQAYENVRNNMSYEAGDYAYAVVYEKINERMAALAGSITVMTDDGNDTSVASDGSLTLFELYRQYGSGVTYYAEWMYGVPTLHQAYAMQYNATDRFSFTPGAVTMLDPYSDHYSIVKVYNGETLLKSITVESDDEYFDYDDIRGEGDDILWMTNSKGLCFTFKKDTGNYNANSDDIDTLLPISVKMLYNYDRYPSGTVNDRGNLLAQNSDATANVQHGIYRLNGSNENNNYDGGLPADFTAKEFSLPDIGSSPTYTAETEGAEPSEVEYWGIKDTGVNDILPEGSVTVGQAKASKGLTDFYFNAATGYYQADFNVEPLYINYRYVVEILDGDGKVEKTFDFYHPDDGKDYSAYQLHTAKSGDVIAAQPKVDLFGYHFSGWTASSDAWASDQTVAPSASFTMPNKSVVLKGKLIPNTYQIVYNANYSSPGDLKYNGKKVSSNVYEMKFTDLYPYRDWDGTIYYYNIYFPYYYYDSRPGITFEGWAFKPDSTNKYYYMDFYPDYDPEYAYNREYDFDAADLDENGKVFNVYGVWNITGHQVSYKLIDDADNEVSLNTLGSAYETAVYDENVEVTVAPKPTVTGYDFEGEWSATNVTINNGKFTMPNADVELTGRLKRHTHNVTYTLTNDAEETPAGYNPPDGRTAVPYNEEVTVETAPAVTGYTFVGWKKDGTVVDKFTMPDADVELTGAFTEDRYELEYVANPPGEGTAGNMPSSPVTGIRYTAVKDGTYALSANVPTYPGYQFTGWQLNDVSGAKNAGDPIPFAAFDNQDKKAIATAQWQALPTHQVTYTVTLPDGVTDVTYTAPAPASYYEGKTGIAVEAVPTAGSDYNGARYAFSGWSTSDVTVTGGSFTMPTKDVHFTGEFTRKSYTVTYSVTGAPTGYTKPAGGTFEVDAAVDVAGTPDMTLYPGYEFTGWQKDGTVVSSFTMPAESVTLTGVFTKKSFTVSYRATGDVPAGWNAPASHSELFEANVTPRAVPAYDTDRYTFVGWQKDGAVVSSFTMPADNVELTGVFSENSLITLRYDANQGGPATALPNQGSAISLNSGDLVTVGSGSGLTKGTQVFNYWSTSANDVSGSQHYSANDKFTIHNDMVLYAIYKDAPQSGEGEDEGEKFTVTYYANGGKGTVPTDSNKYSSGDTVQVADKDGLTREDCTFREWNTKPDGSGDGYAGDGSATFTMSAGNVKLYAIWVGSDGKIVPAPRTGESMVLTIVAINLALISAAAALFVVMRRRQSGAEA